MVLRATSCVTVSRINEISATPTHRPMGERRPPINFRLATQRMDSSPSRPERTCVQVRRSPTMVEGKATTHGTVILGNRSGVKVMGMKRD